MRMTSAWTMGLGIMATTAIGTSASAQGAPSAPPSGYVESRNAGATSVVFDDDLVQTPGMDASAVTLKVRGGPARFLLVRPRLNFLQELRKSVEAL